MKIYYEDEEIIVCEKPFGIPSEDTGGICMPGLIRDELKEKGTAKEVYCVHRLDRSVGGIMVYALSKHGAADLSKQIAEKKMIKEYEATIHGIPDPLSGELRDLLFKDSRKNKVFVVSTLRKGVREALLKYDTVSSFEKDGSVFSKVHIVLETGRTHQIRVQFASRGMPVAGDRKYGAKDGREKIALVSAGISFDHPKTHSRMHFTTESGI